MASKWSYKPKDQNLSYQGKFQWNFDQGKGNLVQVSGELELSEFELTVEMTEKWGKSKGNRT